MTGRSERVHDAGTWLGERLGKARHRVVLCSAWVGAVPWEGLNLHDLPEGCELTIAFRWPQTLAEAHHVSATALAQAPAQAQLRCLEGTLHAKVYIIDDHVYVGSGNLTRAGLGLAGAASNLELGLAVHDDEVAEELAEWVLEHVPHTPRRKALAELARWTEDHALEASDLRPPALVCEAPDPVDEALQRLEASAMVLADEGHAKGRRMRHLSVRSSRTGRPLARPQLAQLLFSLRSTEEPAHSYHFDLTGRHVQLSRPKARREAHKLRHHEHLHALVFVPKGAQGGIASEPAGSPPVVWVELSRLLGRGRPIPLNRVRALRRTMRIYLVRIDGHWVLQASSSSKGPRDLTIPLEVEPTPLGPVAHLA